MIRFSVRTLLAPSGERLPILLDRSTGMPVFYPNLYVLTELRQTNRASATIERALRELAVLLDYLVDIGVDLNERMREGRLFFPGEIDGLARHCRHSVKSSKVVASSCAAPLGLKRTRSLQTVSHVTAANRLRTIHAYLSWLIVLRMSYSGQHDVIRSALAHVKENVLPTLKARIPAAKGRNILGLRQGLHPEMLDRLLQAVDPTYPNNPWKSEFSRQRNALIVCWLLMLGVRRGELLNVKISDIDFRKNEVMIARRADDPVDPRRAQPKVKTRDRILPLSSELATESHKYIIQDRRKIYGATTHEYLFVAEHTGYPMSISTLSKVFQTLKFKICDLPANLSPHVLRHTWNDEFSRQIDRKNIGERREQQMRNYLMGWSQTSATAGTYNKRFVQKEACDASLKLQTMITTMNKDEK